MNNFRQYPLIEHHVKNQFVDDLKSKLPCLLCLMNLKKIISVWNNFILHTVDMIVIYTILISLLDNPSILKMLDCSSEFYIPITAFQKFVLSHSGISTLWFWNVKPTIINLQNFSLNYSDFLIFVGNFHVKTLNLI